MQPHLGFQALHAFRAAHGDLPAPSDASHAAELLSLAKGMPGGGEVEFSERLLRNLASGARGELSPLCAFFGGIAAQEVMKACSGKFTPLKQWMYFDAEEALPGNGAEPLPAAETAPRGSRYDAQACVLGWPTQEQLGRLQYLLVGAGAIGCEMVKNWAMMGLGAGEGGKVVVTDPDTIEKSNLNRQFLFRPWDVSKAKSETAAAAIQQMNPQMAIEAQLNRVGPETEDIFDDDFWEALSGVCNALDNVQARLYVDQRCVYYQKSLLESGTLGAKGNVQLVVPRMTESYGSSRDPPEKSIPVCTLKNFPNEISHCIQWSRDIFEGLFKQSGEDVNAYLSQPDYLAALERQPGVRRTTLNEIRANLVEKPLTLEACVVWARLKFEELYHNQARALGHRRHRSHTITPSPRVRPRFPRTKPSSPRSRSTWSPRRARRSGRGRSGRPPSASTRAIRSTSTSSSPPPTCAPPTTASRVVRPRLLPAHRRERDGARVPPKEGEGADRPEGRGAEEAGAPRDGPPLPPPPLPHDLPTYLPSSKDVDEIARGSSSSSPPSSLAGYRMTPAEFEKDDDTNHHVDFITACSNLRARNYKIGEADRHKTKQIAGKIIPAIATTTAMVTGLVCVELLKLLQPDKKIEDFKNAFCNLALPFVSFSEPIAAPKKQVGASGMEWTLWDRYDIDEGRELTLREFIDLFKERYKLEVTMISSGVSILYSFFTNQKKLKERYPMKMSELVQDVSKTEFKPKQKYLTFEICCNDMNAADDADEEDVEVPYVRYRFAF